MSSAPSRPCRSSRCSATPRPPSAASTPPRSIPRSFTRADAEPEQLSSLNVTASFVPTLGLTLARGRNFNREEDAANGPPVCLLAYGVWQTKFGGREDIVGTTIMLDGVGSTVVGACCRRKLPAPISFVQLLAPWPFRAPRPDHRPAAGRRESYLQVTARLKPGVSYEQADAEVHTIAKRYAAAYPGRLDANGENELRTWIEVLQPSAPCARPSSCCSPRSASSCSSPAPMFPASSSAACPRGTRKSPCGCRWVRDAPPALQPVPYRDGGVLCCRGGARRVARRLVAGGHPARAHQRQPAGRRHGLPARPADPRLSPSRCPSPPRWSSARCPRCRPRASISPRC